jgi:siroheme synthase-like protein
LILDLSGRLVVIVGGGAVAARKAAGVVEAGGERVRCVATAFHPEIPAGVERILAAYESRHLDGASFVFAATDVAEVNEAVVRDARARGIWVNRADGDEAAPGDFITPAKLEAGAVIVTVSAGSAALTAAIRDHVAQAMDRRYILMADAMRTLRPAIRRRSATLSAAQRAQVFRDLAGEEALASLDEGGIDGLRAWLLRRFPELTDV